MTLNKNRKHKILKITKNQKHFITPPPHPIYVTSTDLPPQHVLRQTPWYLTRLYVNIHQPPPTACAAPDSLVSSVPSLITKFCFLTTMAHTNLHVEGLGASPCVNKIHFPPDCAECCWVPRYQSRKVHCCEAMCARILQYILL